MGGSRSGRELEDIRGPSESESESEWPSLARSLRGHLPARASPALRTYTTPATRCWC